MWLEKEPPEPIYTKNWCTHFVNCLAPMPFLINLFQLKVYVKRSNCLLTLHINVHQCRVLSTSVVCSTPVISSLSSVDVNDCQWVSLDMLIRRDVCPQKSWIRNTFSRPTVHCHIITFCDIFIFDLLHRCWD